MSETCCSNDQLLQTMRTYGIKQGFKVHALPSKIDPPPYRNLPDTCSNSDTKDVMADYLTIIFEHWWEQLFPLQGSLLLNMVGTLLQSTPRGRELCQKIQRRADEHNTTPTEEDPIFELPHSIQKISKLLIESQKTFPNQKFQLHEEVFNEEAIRIYLKAEWIEL
ncbi:MAG: hypothetical protein AAFW84_16185 [Cyanobacteria bacterium J06635_15]